MICFKSIILGGSLCFEEVYRGKMTMYIMRCVLHEVNEK